MAGHKNIPWDENGNINPFYVPPKVTYRKPGELPPPGHKVLGENVPDGLIIVRRPPVDGVQWPGAPFGGIGTEPRATGERHGGEAVTPAVAVIKPERTAYAEMSDAWAKAKLHEQVMTVPERELNNLLPVGVRPNDKTEKAEGKPSPRRAVRRKAASKNRQKSPTGAQ